MEDDLELRLNEFEVKFTGKMEDIDNAFQSIVREQNYAERLITHQQEECKILIEKKDKELNEHMLEITNKTMEEIMERVNKRNLDIELKFKEISEHIDALEESFVTDQRKIDTLAQDTGSTKTDIEEMLKNVDEVTKQKIENIEKKLADLNNILENTQERMYEHEANKKNNLIFYGISQEERESTKKLLAKVLEIIHIKLNIKREVCVRHVGRLYAGPDVHGCRPVLVTFEEFNDREDVLATSKVMKETGITITEDISKKVREARQELKKFLRVVKRNSPDKYCFLQYDKLFVGGKVFVYDETEGKVMEQNLKDERCVKLLKSFHFT